MGMGPRTLTAVGLPMIALGVGIYSLTRSGPEQQALPSELQIVSAPPPQPAPEAPKAESEPLKEVGRYRARLSILDHCSIDGRRLPHAEAVLSQDRANLHRYCPKGDLPCDEEDEKDDLFTTPARRQTLARIATPALSAETRRLISEASPLVEVGVFGGPPRLLTLRVIDPGSAFLGCPKVTPRH